MHKIKPESVNSSPKTFYGSKSYYQNQLFENNEYLKRIQQNEPVFNSKKKLLSITKSTLLDKSKYNPISTSQKKISNQHPPLQPPATSQRNYKSYDFGTKLNSRIMIPETIQKQLFKRPSEKLAQGPCDRENLKTQTIVTKEKLSIESRESKIPLLRSLLRPLHSPSKNFCSELDNEQIIAQRIKNHIYQPEAAGQLKLSANQSSDQIRPANGSGDNQGGPQDNFSQQSLKEIKDKFSLKYIENLFFVEEVTYELQADQTSEQQIIQLCNQYMKQIDDSSYIQILDIFFNPGIKMVLRECIIQEKLSIYSILILCYFGYATLYSDNLRVMTKLLHENATSLIQLMLLVLAQYQIFDPDWSKLQMLFHLKTNTPQVCHEQEIYQYIDANNSQLNQQLQFLINNSQDQVHQFLKNLSLQVKDQQNFSACLQLIRDLSQEFLKQLTEENTDSTITQKTIQFNNISIQNNEDLPPDIPYLPEIDPKYSYTLVLDLDETLIHYQEFTEQGGEFLIRPYAEKFIEILSQYYEIVIFTAAQQEYADWILDKIDKNGHISHRLYRKHITHDSSSFYKDLDNLGRDLNKIIIIDNLSENFRKHRKNGIFIKSWFGEEDDTALYDLVSLLKQIVVSHCPDVKLALEQFGAQILENVAQGKSHPNSNLNLN